MSLTFNTRRQAWARLAFQRSCRHISQFPKLIPQRRPDPQFLRPRIYDSQSSTWVALKASLQGTLESGNILKVISWNLFWNGLDPAARASAALEYLRTLPGNTSRHQVVMLQEICLESLRAILENPWVQRNFILSDVCPPDSLYKDIPGESFSLRRLKWEAAPYFTLMMISKDLGIMDCFRVPFVTNMGRDALVVDLPISDLEGEDRIVKSIRLCTTHLESIWEGKALRPGQLALISDLLKGVPVTNSRPIAGLVGGDMNAIEPSEHEFHRAEDVRLKDVWEDIPAPPVPILKPFQKDLSYGHARGNTWGYQTKGASGRKRLDKFFYTGSIETVALSEVQDIVGKLGRLGISLQTEVEAWKRGRLVKKLQKEHYSGRIMEEMQGRGWLLDPPPVRTRIITCVSDHFGIAVGVKVL